MSTRKNVLVLNGPNLNMLGTREPAIYGSTTLADIEAACVSHGAALDLAVTCRQSNLEGELVTWIQEARGVQAGIILNAGAYTHTSIAIPDALTAAEVPFIELHLSNVFAREEFRHHSWLSPLAKGVICGFGAKGYSLALDAMADILD
ncbi:MAG: type II 3-dehydroquinate dehydratase [Alphaproteobacteria bacterium]|nr:type II 3-dehydroquinate dehydratase [Alphaproteobacteria bacterium]